MAVGANPAMVVGTGSDNDAGNRQDNANAGNGRDEADAVAADGMTMSVGSASPTRAATPPDLRYACRGGRERRDLHCAGGNGG